jgi:hypothetical protein
MQHQANARLAEAVVGWAVDEARAKAARLGGGIVEICAICANAWAAANMYEELSRLSVAELARRGIPRAELHRHVFMALDDPAASGPLATGV